MKELSTAPLQHRNLRGILVQLLGIAIGIAALAWCIHLALQPQNKEALAQLRGISFANATGLLALTFVSIALNGLCFWATIRGQKQLNPVDLIATNCIATLLALVPFKASLVFRVLIHNRRDNIPLFTIGAWFAAVGVGALLVVGPIIIATYWREKIDVPWMMAVGLGTPTILACVMMVANAISGPDGLQRVQAIAHKLPTSLPARFSASGAFAQMHSGCDMVSSRWFVVALVFRAADLLVQAARFYLVSQIMGIELSFGNAMLFSGCYFLIGVLSPSGAAGSREAGVTALAKLRAVISWESLAPIALTVTACELIVLVVLSPIAALILKPWRLKPTQPPASSS